MYGHCIDLLGEYPNLPDVGLLLEYAKFQDEIFRGHDFTWEGSNHESVFLFILLQSTSRHVLAVREQINCCNCMLRVSVTWTVKMRQFLHNKLCLTRAWTVYCHLIMWRDMQSTSCNVRAHPPCGCANRAFYGSSILCRAFYRVCTRLIPEIVITCTGCSETNKRLVPYSSL